MDEDEFKDILGDDFEERMEEVQMDESTKAFAEFFKGLKQHGLDTHEAAAVIGAVIRSMGVDFGGSR